MNSTAKAYWELMRFDRPVGTLLLLWPTLAALWIAADGLPPLGILFVFFLGTVVMRAAGCVINDIADRNFDPHVERTKSRPLADGRLSLKQAFLCLGALMLLGLGLVMLLNATTRWMALVGVLLATVYPFMKRFTHLPQIGLGVAFSWGIPMAGTAISETVSLPIWVLFWMSFVWVIAYDTQYAMVDREDDLKVGLKSTAILLDKLDVHTIAFLNFLAVGILVMLGVTAGLNVFFYGSLGVISALLAYQTVLIRNRDRDKCFRAFRSNSLVGLALFVGVVLSYVTRHSSP